MLKLSHCPVLLATYQLITGSTQAAQGYKTWFVSSLLCTIRKRVFGCIRLIDIFYTVYNRWLYRYGLYEARTDRHGSLDLVSDHPGGLVPGILSFCTPYAYNTYVERLEKVWVDRIVSVEGWQKLLTFLLQEWSDSNLLVSCVMHQFPRKLCLCP